MFAIGETSGLSRAANVTFAIGIIVANVPEGLLPTLTLALAMASRRMARRQVLVRRLTSVETLGATTVICTDKTGTLTENRMAVRRIFAQGQFLESPPQGSGPHSGLRRALECARWCHDLKETDQHGARWLGDPTEIALVTAAAVHVPDEAPKTHEIRRTWKRISCSTRSSGSRIRLARRSRPPSCAAVTPAFGSSW